MLTVNIICVGKLKEMYWKDACNEYIKRLSAFCKLNIREFPEYNIPHSPSKSEIIRALELESKLILNETSGYIVSLCIEGKCLSSKEMAEKINEICVSGKSAVSFIIGSSHGIADIVKNKSDILLSMSKMTFPHQMARVMILEQLYRAFSINSGGKYHK